MRLKIINFSYWRRKNKAKNEQKKTRKSVNKRKRQKKRQNRLIANQKHNSMILN
jgi:hypothetical protein